MYKRMTHMMLAALFVAVAAVPTLTTAQQAVRPAYDPATEPVAQDIFQELLSPY